MSKVPYQLLELSIISAQDLAPVSKNLRTYVVIWISPKRKLKTCVDQHGHNNPTWNDKFVFRVDDKFLTSETDFVIIEIYAVGWLRDTPVGSISVLLSSLIPPSVRLERRFLALQIRRPSGRPQGILNMGVSLLDNTMRSMPLCTELSGSTVGFQDLWSEKSLKNDEEKKGNGYQGNAEGEKKESPGGKKLFQLLRSLSDKTDVTRNHGDGKKKKAGSMCNGCGQGSVATGAGLGSVIDCRYGSVITGRGGGSVVNGGSMVNGSVCNSDLGPSASVVAAAVAMGLYPIQQGPPPKPGSSVLEDWTVEDSTVEGLESRIDRWRMDLPQGYERYERLEKSKKKDKKRHQRRRRTLDDDKDEDDGRFTCFGTAYGCEFTIVCGGGNNDGGKKNRRRGYSSSKTSDSE